MSNDDMWGALGESHSGSDEDPNGSLLPEGPSHKKAIVISSVLLSLVLAGGLGFAIVAGGDKDTVVNPAPTQQGSSNPIITPETGPKEYDEALVDLETWQKGTFPNDLQDFTQEQRDWAREQVEDTRLEDITKNAAVSEEAGFTSDYNKSQDELGLPNPFYAFWTQEVFLEQSTIITEALINPVFGGWASYQTPESNVKNNIDTKPFASLFTKKYQKANFGKKDKSYLPFFVDWNNNSYGGEDIAMAGGAYWIGEIVDADSKWTYDKDILNYRVRTVYDIEYTAADNNYNKLTRKAKLEVLFVPNLDANGSESAYRVLVDEAKLTVKN